jgi:hypothetical protein
MVELRFEDLTQEQKDYLVDDCGKPGFLDVPDFVFEIACERHDFDYWVGNTKEDRYKADRRMYDTMVEAIKEEPWYRRIWLYPVAWTYYIGVRLGSSSFFYYGPRKRTLEDLENEMASNIDYGV